MNVSTTTWVVLAIYAVILIIMGLIGFKRVLDWHEHWWRRLMLGKQEGAVPEMRLHDDCWRIHRLAKLEEESFGVVFSAGVTNHLEYCNKYPLFIPEAACIHPSEDRQVEARLDGSAIVICTRCGSQEYREHYLRG
jgi:hypothetical protein